MEGADIPTFGEALASFRTRARLSQQQLAKRLGKNRRSVAAWEAGDYLPKTKGDVIELARILVLNDEEATTLLKAAGIDPSLAIWNIPYPRNLFFTGRDQELEQLYVQLQQGTTAVVGQAQSISGLGGIGKTQLAVEYAYCHHDTYQYVFWARAESIAALNASYSELARLLNLPEKDAEEQEKVTQAVKHWLVRRRSWLLILDNADSPALLPDFLPPTVGGHLLITTRSAEVSAHLAGLAHPLVVDSFSDEQGALFLLHRSGLLALDATLNQAEPAVQQLALSIAHELGGLPLALDQAGAYLKATNCSLSTYQQLYQQRRAQLLTERRGADHPEPVATTWNMSFRKVEQQNSAAADLLRLCAFLAPDAIPEEILAKGADALSSILAPIVADPFLLNETIESLRVYSLIARDPHTRSLIVHRLVQAVLRDSLSTEIQQQWMQRIVQVVNITFPDIEFANWPACEHFLPHALLCAVWIEQEQITTLDAAHMLNMVGRYLSARGRYAEVESLYQRALAIYEQVLGLEHPDVGASLNNLGSLYESQGKYAEAESLYQRGLDICEREWGSEDSPTAVILNNLASLYMQQGKFAEAEPLLRRALAIYEQQLGPEHPDTATNLDNLARLYQRQGKYVEAEPLYQHALAIREQQLGLEHPSTTYSLNNLGSLYESQGKYAEAESLYQRALAIREQQLGLEHPDTAVSLNNLGSLYGYQEKYVEAERLLQRALTIQEQQLGSEHPDTAASLINLGNLYGYQEKYVEAERLLQRALTIQEHSWDRSTPTQPTACAL